MPSIYLLVWKASKEQLELVQRIYTQLLVLTNKAEEEFPAEIIDLSVYELPKIDTHAIVFGTMAYSMIENQRDDLIWQFDDLSCIEDKPENREARKETFEHLKKLAARINNKDWQSPVEAHVETLDGITIGRSSDSDIQILKEELRFIRDVKDLLKGCKIIIKKGNIKIEVEDANEDNNNTNRVM